MTEFSVFMPLQNIAPRNRSSGTRFKIVKVYSDIKVANNTNIYHKVISFTDHYNTMTIDRSPSKTKDFWHFNNPLLYIIFKNKEKQISSSSDWWKYTKCCFKENAGTFSKNSTTQENIRISRLKKDCETYI